MLACMLCACARVRVRAWARICARNCVHVFVRMCAHLHMPDCARMRVCACGRAWSSTCVRVRLCVCMCRIVRARARAQVRARHVCARLRACVPARVRVFFASVITRIILSTVQWLQPYSVFSTFPVAAKKCGTTSWGACPHNIKEKGQGGNRMWQ